jgi:AcrR family transcriptional regulator
MVRGLMKTDSGVAVSRRSSEEASGDAPRSSAGDEKVDGRRAWRQRNRDAVVDALLDLYREGNLSPGTDELVERSGVSRRSLFRYFDDLNDLCRAAIARQIARASHLIAIQGIGVGPLDDRITRLVRQRADLYHAIAPAARVGRLRAPFQPVVAEQVRQSRAVLRRQVEKHFAPELDRLTPECCRETLDAADLLCSFESFALLRETQGLNRQQYQRTIRRALTALLEDAAG